MDIRLDGYCDLVTIGRGGFGTVYRAYEQALDRTVAIKVLTGRLDADARTRFTRERLAMSRLSDHPNVVPVYRIGATNDGRPYLVMPYLAAGSAADRLNADGPLSWSEAVRITIRLAGALETAHRLGVVHRDVKPANILMSDYGEPLLTDFGIARVSGGFETTAGQVTASIAFAAPELLEGGVPTPAADIYSLGATLFTLLAGHPPFEPRDDEELLSLYRRIARDPVPDLRSCGIPDQLCRVMEQAMAKRPPQRPRTALDLGVRLQTVERAEGQRSTEMALGQSDARLAAATVTQPAAVSVRPRRRRRMLVGALAAVVLGSVGAAAVYSLSSTQDGNTTRHSGGTPVTLSATPTTVQVRTAAGKTAMIKVAVRAGERMVGHIHVDPLPLHAPAINVVAGNSPIEQTTLNGQDAVLNPVTFDSTGTVIVELGPSDQAFDAAINLSLAPSDIRRTIKIGAPPLRLDLPHPQQTAYVSFTGRRGTRVRFEWNWLGTNPRYTSIDLRAPDGNDLAAGGWSAYETFRSPAVRLPSNGTYMTRVSIDGETTGAGTLAVTAG